MKLEAGDSSVKREAGDSSQGSQGSGGVKVERIDSSADAEAADDDDDDDRKGPMASPVGSPRSSPVEQQPSKRQKRTAVKAAAAKPSGPHYARAHGSVGSQRSADDTASRGARLERTMLTPFGCRQQDIREKHVATKVAAAAAKAAAVAKATAVAVKVEDGVWHLLRDKEPASSSAGIAGAAASDPCADQE